MRKLFRKLSISFWILALLLLTAGTYESGILILHGGANSYGNLATIDGSVTPVDKLIISVTGGAGYITPESLGIVVVNVNGDNTDFVIEGDTDANLFNLDAGTDKIGIGEVSPAEKLEIAGNTLISNAGGDSNSYKLILHGHMTAGDETQISSFYTAWGADPYLVIATPNAVGAETSTLHISSTLLGFATDNTTDIGATGATRPKDIFLSGNLDAELGSITAQTGLTTDTGDIKASAGDLIVDGGDIGITGDLDILQLAAAAITINGAATITNAGGDSDSYKLVLEAHMTAGDETQTSSIRTAWGLNPYMVIATPDAVGAETDVIHLDTVSLRFANDNSIDIGATGANRPKDIYTSGSIKSEGGAVNAATTMTAGTGIVCTLGDINANNGDVVASTNVTATAGAVSAGTTVGAGSTVTAGTGITSTTGNVTASAGSHVDQYANVRVLRPIVASGTPAEPFDCTAAVYGWMIPIVDTDAGADWLCWCGKLDNTPTYEWRKVSDEGSCFP